MTLSPERIEMGKTAIGGSEAAAAVNANDYKTPVQLWMEKTGRAEPEPESEAAYWGTVLEPTVLKEYERRAKPDGYVHGPLLTRRSKEYPYMIATPDALVSKDKGRDVIDKYIVQAKTCSTYLRDKWGQSGSVLTEAADETIPTAYMIQVQHEMIVTGFERCDVAVLIGGQEFRWYTVHKDEKFCELLVELERKFWEEHVLADVAPEVATLDDFKLLFPEDDGSIVTADDETYLNVVELQATRAGIAEECKRVEDLEFAIKRHMGKAGKLLVDRDGQEIATWKSHMRQGQPVRPFKVKIK